MTIGAIPPTTLARVLTPLWIAALGIGISNAVFSVSNGDPSATTLIVIGPLRITTEAVATALSVILRVSAVAAVGAVFTLTTDSTRLADLLVQQARLPARFAYGALAAYQSIPRFVEDLTTLRQARRIRGLRGSWHPRLLIGVLVLAIRHGDRMALSMDLRAFGSGPRTDYRVVRWSVLDLVIGAAAVVILAAAFAFGR